MLSVRIALWAVLVDNQTLLEGLFVLLRTVVQRFALNALQFDQCFLGHMAIKTVRILE